jgi:hypothetical protein
MTNNRIYSLSEIKNIILPIIQSYGIESVYIFGSYARNEANEKSDIDLYIPTLPANMGIKFFGMYEELKENLGKNIDIVTDDTEFLSIAEKEYFIDNINRDKVEVCL